MNVINKHTTGERPNQTNNLRKQLLLSEKHLVINSNHSTITLCNRYCGMCTSKYVVSSTKCN